MAPRKKQVKRLTVVNVRATEAEYRFLKNLARESAHTISQLMRELIQREKKVRENRRARWGKKARKYLSPRLREAMMICLNEANWRERIQTLLADKYDEGVLAAYLDNLFDDILPGELTNYAAPAEALPLPEQTSLPTLPLDIPHRP